jgi:hypothetical protein
MPPTVNIFGQIHYHSVHPIVAAIREYHDLAKYARTLFTLALQQPDVNMATFSVMPISALTPGSVSIFAVVFYLAHFSDPSSFLDILDEKG